MHSIESLKTIIDSYQFRAGEELLFDKPLDWTSFDVVNKIRYIITKAIGGKIKVGHAGTLDPKASGLLILCTGKKTKTIDSLQGMDKVYTGTFKLGATTPCYDTEMEEDAQFPIDHITAEMIQEKTKDFIGQVEQEVPIFSAIKVDGKRMYEMARKGEEVRRKSRTITINDFKISKIEMPYVDFEVSCSKGTYIRSLAHEFGQALKSGGYLTALRRTKIGEFNVEDAWDIDTFIKLLLNEDI